MESLLHDDQKYLGLAALTLYLNSYLRTNSVDPFEKEFIRPKG